MTCERGIFSNDDVIDVDVIIGVNMSMCLKDFIEFMKNETQKCEQHFYIRIWWTKNKWNPKKCVSIFYNKIVLLQIRSWSLKTSKFLFLIERIQSSIITPDMVIYHLLFIIKLECSRFFNWNLVSSWLCIKPWVCWCLNRTKWKWN